MRAPSMLPEHLCRGLLEVLPQRKRAPAAKEYFAVLTPSRLQFFHNNEEWVANHATVFDIYVPSIVALEDVSGQESNGRRLHVFKVIVSVRTTDERRTVTCAATSSADHSVWLQCLNKGRLANEVWLTWFHPGAFDEKWSCCNRSTKPEEGCVPTTNCTYPNAEDPLFRRKGYAAQFAGYGAILTRIARLQTNVSLNRGDHVIVLDFVKADESLALVASAVNPQVQGTLPKLLLQMGDIREEAWFFQELPPTLATALLQCMTSGTFLVRSFRRRLALSIVVDDTVRHHWIHQDEKGLCYVEADLRFPAIQEMVLFYSRQPRLGHRLNQFPKRENLEKLWHLDKKQLDLKKELYSQHLPFIHHSGTYGPVSVMGVSSRPKQSRSEVDVLRRTARLLMCLDHQNLVRLIGVYHDEPTFSLVLEEVPPITTFIASYGFERLQQEWEILITFAHHLATAVLYLHRKGIVHNEVVVENCFLQTETFTAKLGNFEYARFEDCRPDSYQEELLQRHSRLVLSPPEVCQKGQASSCQTDLWGFGLLLWSLFQTGGQPCSLLNVQQLINCRWSHLQPELASVLGQLALSCMHEVPQLRISAYELAKQLRNLLELRKHLKGRSHSSQDMLYDHRAMTASSTSEVASGSPQLNVKAKKKRRFLRSARKASSGADSPSSTTASSLENVQFPLPLHSRSASASPASGLLKGLRGLFGGGGGNRHSAAPSPTVFPPADVVPKSTSFSGPPRAAGEPSRGGSDSNETLSWDGWSPASDAASPEDSELQFQYDRLREYCRALLLKLKRERRERIRLTGELARVREELELRALEAESASRQLGREHAVQSRASEERLRRLQSELRRLQEELHTRHNGAGPSPEEESAAGTKPRLNGVIVHPKPPSVDLLRPQSLKDPPPPPPPPAELMTPHSSKDSSPTEPLRPQNINSEPPPRPARPPPAPPHRGDSLSRGARSPGSDSASLRAPGAFAANGSRPKPAEAAAKAEETMNTLV